MAPTGAQPADTTEEEECLIIDPANQTPADASADTDHDKAPASRDSLAAAAPGEGGCAQAALQSAGDDSGNSDDEDHSR